MIAHVSRKQLANALSNIERIVPSRSSNPNLSLVKLELADGVLTLSGSNLDIDIRAAIAVDTQDQGSWALPAQVFSQVVRALPGELVELSFETAELELQSGAYATKLQLVDASLPELTFPQSYPGSFAGEKLSAALSHVRYAAAVAEYQAIFRGVRLEFDDRHVRAVATDGFRLAYYHLDEVSGLDGNIVLPARSVDELTKVLGESEVKLELSDSQLSLATGPYKLNLNLMEGTFPDYQRVIPAEFPVSVVTSAKELLEGVQRVALMADRTANNRVDLFVRGGAVQIMAEGAYGRSQEALNVAQEGSESEIALAYNADYLLSALRPIGGDVRFSFSGPTSPSVLSSLQDPSYLAMVVPLRTG
jgi:DNA polymerase III subunit beta